MKKFWRLTYALSAHALILMLMVSSNGIAAPGGPAPRKSKTSENEAALRHYREGLRHRDAAWVYEEKMAGTQGEERESYARFIQTTYRRALDEFRKATALDSTHYQAFSSLGYILRKTGDMDGALAAYDRALALNPNYAEAIEYRAEAHVMLGRVDDMKRAYGVLAELNRPHAARLLTFVTQWADRKDNAELRAWAKKKKEALGEVEEFIEKW